VVLFTLLVQGLTTQPLLAVLGLIGDQPLRQEYLEGIARRIALNRVQNYLSEAVRKQEIDAEFYRYQAELVKGELQLIQSKLDEMEEKHIQLQELSMKMTLEEMIDIEADTYAEFIRSGRLNNQISPILWHAFETKEQEKQKESEATG
jgi:CPA1 family monovalent cation:H+ antiporter